MYSLSLSVAIRLCVYMNMITILTHSVILFFFGTAYMHTFLFQSVPIQWFYTNFVRWQMAIVVFKQLFNIHRPFRMLFPRYIHGTTQSTPVFKKNSLCKLPSWDIWTFGGKRRDPPGNRVQELRRRKILRLRRHRVFPLPRWAIFQPLGRH